MDKFLSFNLSPDFVAEYANKDVPWGNIDAGGNSVGELTFIRTYSRIKPDGTKERWHEVCQRVIEGMYSIQKDHIKSNRLEWNERKAQTSAKEAYDRLFNLKWTPPGRGLWVMGTPLVNRDKNSAALQNCANVSTYEMERYDPGAVYAWIMDALMLGIGVGWDTRGAEKNFTVTAPGPAVYTYEIPDTREGWSESVRLLLNSYLRPQPNDIVAFDYTAVRPAGEPIKTFGGVASGPEPLRLLHERLRSVLEAEVGNGLSSRLIADIINLEGVCVVSGNVRRSATLGLGRPDDDDFINLKNPEVFAERNSIDPENPGWGWMSNNSVSATVGMDYSRFIDSIVRNGEPGFIWLGTARRYGRLLDAPDYKDMRCTGMNPCSEQPLESYETCTLVETHINRAESLEDFLRTLKFAYLYGKTVTLLPTHWERTNAVMQRNRRIGSSTTGIAGFVERNGLTTFRDWANEGFKVTKNYDVEYSEWMGVRESIRSTTVKPSGSVSLLSGATPGVHFPPGGEYCLRAIRFQAQDAIVERMQAAGYTVEDDIVSANTKVVYFPIHTPNIRSARQVSIFEKIYLAVEAQRHWSDNGVSVTVSFDAKTEAEHLPTVLSMYEGQLKAVSFLPMGNEIYAQQPYTEITADEYNAYCAKLDKVNFDTLYNNGVDATGERYCTTDVCMV